jgi:hypothetical protein
VEAPSTDQVDSYWLRARQLCRRQSTPLRIPGAIMVSIASRPSWAVLSRAEMHLSETVSARQLPSVANRAVGSQAANQCNQKSVSTCLVCASASSLGPAPETLSGCPPCWNLASNPASPKHRADHRLPGEHTQAFVSVSSMARARGKDRVALCKPGAHQGCRSRRPNLPPEATLRAVALLDSPVRCHAQV